MPDPSAAIEERVRAALVTLGPSAADADPSVRPSKVADYQINAAFELAKRLGRNPREVASELVEALDVTDLCREVEVAGPGYINLTLDEAELGRRVLATVDDPRLGVALAADPRRVVLDYSAPNVAKEMHVGHLRSTVIGDALARLLGHLGHDIVRQNHLGDWGTPFGMLVEHMVDIGEDTAAHELSIGDLNTFYTEARAKFDADDGFADRARQRVVALQAGEPTSMRLWRLLVEESQAYFSRVYDDLGVTLTADDYAGESSYNDRLDGVVDELRAAGLLVTDDGAECVFPPGLLGRDGQPQPVIVRKRDGGYGYAATDLAAIRHRLVDLDATWLLYVVGAPQADHLGAVFAVAEMAGWLVPPAQAEHVSFGSVLGGDGKMFRTREGGTVKLAALLDEAVRRASEVVAAKSPDLDDAEAAAVARAIGIGAVKYADLSVDRVKDYVFDWDRMLAITGNTAPYLQYAHARMRSILRKAAAGAGGDGDGDGAGGDGADGDGAGGDGAGADVGAEGAGTGGARPGALRLDDPTERALALSLLGFDSAVAGAARGLHPHRLCTYLFDLASTFTSFYEACPVLSSTGETRATRLLLCECTAEILAAGLALLGIEAPERV